MANPEHVEIVRQGANAIILRGANLRGANLRDAGGESIAG